MTLPIAFAKVRNNNATGANVGVGFGEALNPLLIAYIGPSLTFTIQGTVLAA